MAGFVGLLRQLGDLAQLAAEVFQGLHDQATAVSARAGGLALGAGRLEAELPLLEERFRRRRNRRPCFVQHNVAIASEVPCRVAGHGVDRPVILVGGTRPCSIEEHIQRCRRPPQLSILDKYDAGGEGACLKRDTPTPPSSEPTLHSMNQTFRVQTTIPNLLPRKPTITNTPNLKQARCPICSNNLNIVT
ncbi:protein SCAR2-like [Triticum dicoccoides]|uniref:protein SCAR2-like n=1 Tax=Triticum dicoccoides TaxID=85692 RepID=UPI0018908A15|nr:protein SCAR2-like [Triticum dicoccoides]XP_037482022.1 protein SCAR2-like [Triticum dicoccoides]